MWIRRVIIVVDDHDIIVGCRLVFEDAGLPWSVRWCASLHDVGDGRVLVILDLRLEDGSTPTQNLHEIRRRLARHHTSAKPDSGA